MHTILVVDDDAAVRRPIARLLGFEGFQVVEASDGQEALTRLQAGPGVAAILLDLRMPVMDGWAFRAIQRSDPRFADIPVIVISGADSDRFNELGAVAALEKPVTVSSVIRLLRDLLPNQ